MDSMDVVHCPKCSEFQLKDAMCGHLRKNIITPDMYPSVPFSITISGCGMHVPREILDDFGKACEELNSVLYIASLERGDKENLLHVQAAAEVRWNK